MHGVSFTVENGKIHGNCVLCEKQFERDPTPYLKEKIYHPQNIVWLACVCDECRKKSQKMIEIEIKKILIEGHLNIKEILEAKNIATKICDAFNIPNSFLEF